MQFSRPIYNLLTRSWSASIVLANWSQAYLRHSCVQFGARELTPNV